MYYKGVFSGYVSINWDGYYPEDKLVNFITEYISPLLEFDVNILIAHYDYLIHIYWKKDVKIGILGILQYSSEEYSKDVIKFVSNIWDTTYDIKENSQIVVNYENLIEDKQNITFDLAWMKVTFLGGEINFPLGHDRREFIIKLSNFILFFKWIFFSLEKIELKEDTITFLFNSINPNFSLNYEDIYLKILNPIDDKFVNLIDKSILHLNFNEYENKIGILLEFIFFIEKLFSPETELIEKLSIFNTNLRLFYLIDDEFFKNLLGEIIIDISKLTELDNKIVIQLFEIANSLHGFNEVELCKIIDGTILEMTIKSEIQLDLEHYVHLITRANNWGTNHLIALLDNLSLLLPNNELGISVLNELLNLVENDLYNSYDGIICLSNLYQVVGNETRAAEIRLSAETKLNEKISQSTDIFDAISSIATYQNLDENYISDLLTKKFALAITYLPSGEIFQLQITEIIDLLVMNKKFVTINNIVEWIKFHVDEIGLNDRITILRIIGEQIVKFPDQFQILLKTRLLQFNQYLDQYLITDDQILLEKAEKLLKTIFNRVDPNLPKYKEKMTIITQSLVLSATNYEEWGLIQEAIHRFNLLINDTEYYNKALIQIFINAGKSREKLSNDNLKHNDIGLKIFDETIKLISQFQSKVDVTLEFLPYAKKLAIKVGDYKRYTIYTTLELNLSKLQKLDWVDILVDSVITLIDKNEIKASRDLFEMSLKMGITPKEEYEILTRQLQLAENELDIINLEEITSKRERMIKIARNNDGIANNKDIIKSYHNGISEILSKGSSEYLHSYLIQAIKFGVSNEIYDLDEFFDPLNDSFQILIKQYFNSHDNENYSKIIWIIRKLFEVYQGNNYIALIPYVIKVVNVNFELFELYNDYKYIYNTISVYNEFTSYFSLKNTTIPKDERTIQEFIHLLDKLFEKNVASNLFKKMEIMQEMIKVFLNFSLYQKINTILEKIFQEAKKITINYENKRSLMDIMLFFAYKINNSITLTEINNNELKLDEYCKNYIKLVLTMPNLERSVKQRLQYFIEQLDKKNINIYQEFKNNIKNYIL